MTPSSLGPFRVRHALLVAAVCVALASVSVHSADVPLPITRVDAIGFTVADMDRAVAFYTGTLGFEKGRRVRAVGPPVRVADRRLRRAQPRGAAPARRGEHRADRVPRAERAADAARCARQRPRLPAHRHRRQRPAAGISGVARPRRGAFVHRSAAFARLESQRRRHRCVLLPRSGSPFPRDHRLPEGQGAGALAAT